MTNLKLTLIVKLSGYVILFCLIPVLLIAGEKEAEKPAFSDLDGDGIRDNSMDTDNDGLPDFENAWSKSESGQNDSALFSFETSEPIIIEDLLTRQEQFRLRRFNARAHIQNRGEFGSTGSGPGSGVGGAIGGACAGGVCFY